MALSPIEIRKETGGSARPLNGASRLGLGEADRWSRRRRRRRCVGHGAGVAIDCGVVGGGGEGGRAQALPTPRRFFFPVFHFLGRRPFYFFVVPPVICCFVRVLVCVCVCSCVYYCMIQICVFFFFFLGACWGWVGYVVSCLLSYFLFKGELTGWQ